MPSNIPKSHEKKVKEKRVKVEHRTKIMVPLRKECARLRVSASRVSWLGVTDKTAEFAES